jgi:hypothetical protein
MKKNIYIIIGVIIIVAVGGWFAFSNNFWKASVKEANVVQEKLEKEVALTINDGEKQPIIFKADFTEGMTAFDLLKNKAQETGLALKTQAYDIGILVQAIGDKEGGQDGKYWMYYVNGETPMISADKEVLKAGDKVEFKFEKSTF